MIKEGLAAGNADEASVAEVLERLERLDSARPRPAIGGAGGSAVCAAAAVDAAARDLTLFVVRNEFVADPVRLRLDGVRHVRARAPAARGAARQIWPIHWHRPCRWRESRWCAAHNSVAAS